MPTSRKLSAGNQQSFIGFFDTTTGLFIGGTNAAPAAGQASGMVQIVGIQEVPLTALEPSNVPDPGDDTILATFQFDSDAVRAYVATMAVQDQQLDAYLQSTYLQTVAGTQWGVADVQNAPELNVCLIHQSRAKYFDPTNRGRAAWETKIVPLATARPLNRQTMAGRAVGVYRMAITEQLGSYTPWGVTFTGDSTTWGNDSPYFLDGRGDYPVHMVAYTGNASLAIIPLDHTPVSAAKTSAFYSYPGQAQGTPNTIVSVSTANKTATVTTAIPTGAYGVIVYQYAKL
jgi:hypothetical protein